MEKITNARIKEEYLRIKHKSGATILLYPMKGYSTAYALFATKYGSVDTTFKTNEDPDFVTVPEGIAHYLEHKLFENDECDAFDLYAKTGANANAYTSFDKTAYLFSCSQKFEENLRILLGFVQEPYFTDATVAKEQGIIGQEIRMYEDDTGWRVFFNCLQAMYEKNPVRIDIAGTIESIAKIDKDLLYRCYNTFYNLNNMVIAVAGNFDVDKTLEICDELLKPSEDHGLQVVVFRNSGNNSEGHITENAEYPLMCCTFSYLPNQINYLYPALWELNVYQIDENMEVKLVRTYSSDDGILYMVDDYNSGSGLYAYIDRIDDTAVRNIRLVNAWNGNEKYFENVSEFSVQNNEVWIGIYDESGKRTAYKLSTDLETMEQAE